MNKRFTRGQAIVLFCRECMGYDAHRGGKVGTPYIKAGMLVKECEDKGCPLWSYRNGMEEGKTRPTKPCKISTEGSRLATHTVETAIV